MWTATEYFGAPFCSIPGKGITSEKSGLVYIHQYSVHLFLVYVHLYCTHSVSKLLPFTWCYMCIHFHLMLSHWRGACWSVSFMTVCPWDIVKTATVSVDSANKLVLVAVSVYTVTQQLGKTTPCVPNSCVIFYSLCHSSRGTTSSLKAAIERCTWCTAQFKTESN